MSIQISRRTIFTMLGGAVAAHANDVGTVVVSAKSESPRFAAGAPGHLSSSKPGSTLGRSGEFAANQPVRYIHCAIRVSFG